MIYIYIFVIHRLSMGAFVTLNNIDMNQQQTAISPTDSVQTQTQISPLTDQAVGRDVEELTLTLQGRTLDLNARAVSWEANIIDNEDMDKKKSKGMIKTIDFLCKVCCIFKKNRAFGESSSEESSDGDDTNAYERVSKNKKKKNKCQNHDHEHKHEHKQ